MGRKKTVTPPTQGELYYENINKPKPYFYGLAHGGEKEWEATRREAFAYRDKGRGEYLSAGRRIAEARAALNDRSEGRSAVQIQAGIDAVDFIKGFDSTAGLSQAGLDYMNLSVKPFGSDPRDPYNRHPRNLHRGLGPPGTGPFGLPANFRTKRQRQKDYNKTIEQKNAMTGLRKDIRPIFQEQSRQFLSRRATRGGTNILSGQPTSQSMRPRVPTINSAATGTTLIRT